MNTVSNAPGWVLIKEALEGIKAVQVYATREEAMDAFKQVTKKLKTTNCKSSYKACEAAVMDKDQTVYIVQKAEDAVRLDGKLIWSVNQSIFYDTPLSPAMFEWRQPFATKEEAVEFFLQRLELYQMQNDIPGIKINYNEERLSAMIYKDDKPVVDLFCESGIVGTITNVGTVILSTI